MGVVIKNIAYYLPENIVSNEDLKKENPDWDISLLEAKTGVRKRHIAGANETALDLAYKACDNLFSENTELVKKIDCIIFCTQSEDYIMPPNACILHKRYNFPDSVMAFDFNLACSGYIYGLAIARGLICSGIAKNIISINADTYSKYIAPKDRSVRALFGDGAAVSYITTEEGENGIIDIECSTSGQNYEKLIVPAGGCRNPKSSQTREEKKDKSGNVRTAENIYMDGMGILAFVNSKVPNQINRLLEKNGLKIGDIDCLVPHQASNLTLESLARLIRIDPDKVFTNLLEKGNTVSASVPIALKDALNCGKIKKGNYVLLSGFGVGLSWGTAILKWQ